MKILKTLLKGLLYVILSPFILLGFAGYVVYSLLLFIWHFIIATIKFFSGGKHTVKTKEDEKVAELVKERDEKERLEKERDEKLAELAHQPQQTGSTTINNFYITPDQMANQVGLNNPQQIETQEPELIEEKEYLGIEEQEEGGNEDE